ncbi:hypothetical protein Cassandra_0397 [Pseudomonas phage Cassandra]|nr:hypothetical protein Cassandra_0397 [Pseudomonas phage Cassandra]
MKFVIAAIALSLSTLVSAESISEVKITKETCLTLLELSKIHVDMVVNEHMNAIQIASHMDIVSNLYKNNNSKWLAFLQAQANISKLIDNVYEFSSTEERKIIPLAIFNGCMERVGNTFEIYKK